MTMTELITAGSLLMMATATALQLNGTASRALHQGEQRLLQTDRLDAELMLSERQLRDLASTLPAGGSVSAVQASCGALAAQLKPQLQAQPVPAGLERRVDIVSGAGGLLQLDWRSSDGLVSRQRILSLAALGLCGGGSDG